MAFTEETKRRAFERAGKRCELCGKQLVFANRGYNGGRGAWEAHHKIPHSQGGSDIISNCMILCYDCHQRPQNALNRKSKDPVRDMLW